MHIQVNLTYFRHITVGEMRKWTKYIVGSIILLIVLYYLFYVEEGFQLKTMNVRYPSKEVFLIAANIQGGDRNYVDIYADTYTSPTSPNTNPIYYESGYTFNEARMACEEMGAELATFAQIKTATALGATWCVASWVSDGYTYAPIQTLCPNTKSKGDSITTHSGTLKKITPSPEMAYPVCWGVKPPEPSVNVRSFSKTSYNMISHKLLNSVMSANSSDLFPATFTADEARYALEQKNYNIEDLEGMNTARTYLINNITRSDNQNAAVSIYTNSKGYTEDHEEGSNGACVILGNIRGKFVDKFNALRTVFSDVSGAVIDMLSAKNQNSFYAANLQDICAEETPESSPSCWKLATLDFTTIYNSSGSDTVISSGSSGYLNIVIPNTSTSRLANLESLNFFKFQREVELCQAYQRIETIETYIGCPSTSRETMGSQCVYANIGSNGPPVSQMVGLDVNAEEFLKLRLQEIAPYLTSENYKNVVSEILNKLSLIIRLPSLNDFNTTNMNFDEVKSRINSIAGFFANMR